MLGCIFNLLLKSNLFCSSQSGWRLKQHDLTEQDHAARLDLITKVHGIQKAEKYIENIPKSFKGELVYRTLLTCCVHLI